MKIKAFLLFALVTLFPSCQKEGLPSVTLESSANNITIESYTNKPAFQLSWTFAGGNPSADKQYLQFSPDIEFLTTYVASTSSDSYVVTYKDLQKMHSTFGVTEDYVLYVRLLIEKEGTPSVYSNKLKILVQLP